MHTICLPGFISLFFVVVVVLIWHNFYLSPLSDQLTPWFLTNPIKDFKLPQGSFLILCFQYISPKLLTQLCSPWGYWIEFPEANGSISELDTPAVCPLQLDPGCYLPTVHLEGLILPAFTSTSCEHLFQQLLVFHRQPVPVPSRAELSLYFPWYKGWRVREKLRANSNFQFTL